MAYFSIVQEFEDKLTSLVDFVKDTAYLPKWSIDALPTINKYKHELIEMFTWQLAKTEDINNDALELHNLIDDMEKDFAEKEDELDKLRTEYDELYEEKKELENQIYDKELEIHDLHKELNYWISAEE